LQQIAQSGLNGKKTKKSGQKKQEIGKENNQKQESVRVLLILEIVNIYKQVGIIK